MHSGLWRICEIFLLCVKCQFGIYNLNCEKKLKNNICVGNKWTLINVAKFW